MNSGKSPSAFGQAALAFRASHTGDASETPIFRPFRAAAGLASVVQFQLGKEGRAMTKPTTSAVLSQGTRYFLTAGLLVGLAVLPAIAGGMQGQRFHAPGIAASGPGDGDGGDIPVGR